MAAGKRKYVRLSPAQWAEVDAIWELGDATLSELAERFGVSTRALQAHFEKNGIVKGSKGREWAAEIKAEIFTRSLDSKGDIVRLANETHRRTFLNASTVEDMLNKQLEHLAANPAEAYRTAAVVKTLSLAAQAMERLHSLKSAALGIDKDDRMGEELPGLVIRDLTPEEIHHLRRKHREEYGIVELDDDLKTDDDDIIYENPDDANDEAA